MIVQHQTTTKTILTLDDEEAQWLRGVMQNPVNGNDSTTDAEMRERFFNAMPNPTIAQRTPT